MLTKWDWFAAAAFCVVMWVLSYCATDIPADAIRTLRNEPAGLPPAVLGD